MSKSESQSELEKLRAEIAQLRQAQQKNEELAALAKSSVNEQVSVNESSDDAEHITSTQTLAPKPTNNEQEQQAPTEPVAPEQAENEQEQIDELMSLLGKEIKDLPTVTTLAVFSLGLLMGRYLR